VDVVVSRLLDREVALSSISLSLFLSPSQMDMCFPGLPPFGVRYAGRVGLSLAPMLTPTSNSDFPTPSPSPNSRITRAVVEQKKEQRRGVQSCVPFVKGVGVCCSIGWAPKRKQGWQVKMG
jgi:hypothetical protein